MEIGVGVARETERGEAGCLDGDAEFLMQFADQRCLGPLAGLELAAGKLPKTGQALSRRPLCHEHPIVRIDQRYRYDQEQAHQER